MNEVKIKFFATHHILFQEHKKAQCIVKDAMQTYLIKIDPHHIDILENKNQILCTFLCHLSDFLYDEKTKVLKIFLKEKAQNSSILLMEIQSSFNDVLKEIMENINERQTFLKFQGPLSYNPAKKTRTSLLSSESPEQNFRGFLNAAGLILFANHLRSIIDNAKMYGIQINKILDEPGNYFQPGILAVVCGLCIQVFLAYLIQILNFTGVINSRQTWILNAANTTIILLGPILFKQVYDIHHIPSLLLIIVSCALWLKLISYAHVWRNVLFLVSRIKEFKTQQKKDLSELIPETEASSDNYEVMKKNSENPRNLLRITDLLYFLAAPTLCFQIVFPRTQRIRPLWLIKRFIELILTILFQSVLWLQYLSPLLEEIYIKSKRPENANNIFFLLESMLKLSIPNLYFWNSIFFGFFQVFLNITAEILCYGDRQFYLDWWNCRDFQQYWKLWNLPVHNWCVRHFYNPLLKRVFTLSALLHELIVSGSISVFGYHAFLEMWFQAPIILIQRKLNKILKLENSQLGNVMFWIGFCFVGQPAAILLYYDIYRNKYG